MSGNCYPGHLFLSARRMLQRITLGLPNKRGQLRARMSELGSTRNQSRSATRDPTRREPHSETRGQNQKRFAARAVTPYAKAAKVSLDGSCVAFFTWRCAVSICNRTRCLIFVWTHCLNEAAGALPVCRANDPRLFLSVNGDDADQASAAVPNGRKSRRRATRGERASAWADLGGQILRIRQSSFCG
jgi:hypothetical protein